MKRHYYEFLIETKNGKTECVSCYAQKKMEVGEHKKGYFSDRNGKRKYFNGKITAITEHESL